MIEQNKPNTEIRLVAMDMDGTLLNDRKELPTDFIPWVQRHKDILKVIASGRQYYQLLKDMEPLGNELIYIAENGGFVFEAGKKIYSNEMTEEDQRLILHLIEKIQGQLPDICLSPILCGERSAYINKSDSSEAKKNASMYYAHLEEKDDLACMIGQDCIVKIAVYVSHKGSEKVYEAVGELPSRLKAVVSADSWVDFANENEDKGLAVEAICKKHGLTRQQCMAFGDYMNDAGLLRSCEESYCMENGLDALKQIAKYIAPPNNEYGVMTVLKARLGE